MFLESAKKANAQLTLAVSGIAGPEGGTPEKPVGLVYVGCHYRGETIAKRFQFKGNRQKVRQSTTQYALITAWQMLKNSEK